MESTLPPAPHSRSAGAKTPESPKNPLQLGCSVTQIRHFFKRTFFNLPLIFENNVKKATVWLHERDEIYRFRKASPFGRGVTKGDGAGKPVTAEPPAYRTARSGLSHLRHKSITNTRVLRPKLRHKCTANQHFAIFLRA